MITRQYIKDKIDQENGIGFNTNLNLKGYVFTKHESFAIFEVKLIESVRVAHIKYVYFNNPQDLISIVVAMFKFFMGNKVGFVFMKEKDKTVNIRSFLEHFNFTQEVKHVDWKYNFQCKLENKDHDCKCDVYVMYR